MEAVEASKPTQIAYGKVTGSNPLKVQVADKLILTREVLVVPEYLTDKEITLSAEGTEVKYIFKNALKTGDKVVMIRNRGGQKYLILDRTVSS